MVKSVGEGSGPTRMLMTVVPILVGLVLYMADYDLEISRTRERPSQSVAS